MPQPAQCLVCGCEPHSGQPRGRRVGAGRCVRGTSAALTVWHTGSVNKQANSDSVLSITTMNVNGIRAAYRKGLGEWLEDHQPDVLLLQEVRAQPRIAEDLLGSGWHTVVHDSALKGRSGVAVAVNRNTDLVEVEGEPTFGLEEDQADVDTGRWLEVPLRTAAGQALRVVSAYFHAGQVNDPRQDQKMRHLEAIDNWMADTLKQADEDTHALVGGDFNVVRGERDIKNWKGNYGKSSGVLDEEMEYLNRWVDEGWADTVRDLAGPDHGPYSWWSYRGRAFDNDTGWRIDYHYATPQFGRAAQRFKVHRAPAYDRRISDHAAVTVYYEV